MPAFWRGRSTVQAVGLVAGPLLALLTYAGLPDSHPGLDSRCLRPRCSRSRCFRWWA
jgi:hypothetical protein